MKTFIRNAALALSVLSLGAAAKPLTTALPTHFSMQPPMPTCPPDDPKGCGIYGGSTK